jgi:ferredoxin-type protein NapG
MDRRDFLRRGIGKVSEAAVKQADARVAERVNWFRPPFALPELEFLLACTRCDACREACPHGVIFPLAVRLGAELVGTPALDLLNRPCHLCADWPCVQACEPKALQLPEAEQPAMPKLALISINTESCLPYLGPECGACRDSCPVDNALQWQAERPVINTDNCTGCALCREACVVEPKAIELKIRSNSA